GTNGIVIQAGANDVVILRNLRINGISSGFNGVRFLSGKDLNVENCYIFGFTQNGLDVSLNQGTQATVHVINSVFKNNTGDGIRATNAIAPAVKVQIVETSVMVSGSNGIEASSNSRISVDRGYISASGASGVASSGAAGSSVASVDYSDINNGNNGITTSTGSFALVSHSTMTSNSGTAYNVTSGSIFAYATGAANVTNGTNRVHDNGATGTPIYITEN